MITAIRWGTRFGCVIVANDLVLPNFYEITLNFTQNTESDHEHMVALERLGVFFSQALDNSLVINAQHSLVELFECGTDTAVLMLPAEPSIHTLTLALMEKISAIVQDRLLIDYLGISSSLTGNTEYVFDPSDSEIKLKPAAGISTAQPWWTRNDLTINDYVHELESGEQIILGQEFSWEELGLGWVPEQQVRAPAETARVMPFKPRVVDTGNTDD
jgi:hypothetical protein